MTLPLKRDEEIRQLLSQKISIDELHFEDFSAQHSRHYSQPNPKHGASHVNLVVVSADFEGLNRVQRSRLVYGALGELIESRGLHALTLKLLSPSEKIEAVKKESL